MTNHAHHAPAVSENATHVYPMHPEVRQEGPGDCPKCGMHLVPEDQAESDHGHCRHSRSYGKNSGEGKDGKYDTVPAGYEGAVRIGRAEGTERSDGTASGTFRTRNALVAFLRASPGNPFNH